MNLSLSKVIRKMSILTVSNKMRWNEKRQKLIFTLIFIVWKFHASKICLLSEVLISKPLSRMLSVLWEAFNCEFWFYRSKSYHCRLKTFKSRAKRYSKTTYKWLFFSQNWLVIYFCLNYQSVLKIDFLRQKFCQNHFGHQNKLCSSLRKFPIKYPIPIQNWLHVITSTNWQSS